MAVRSEQMKFQILCWILKFYPLPWTPLYISPSSASEALPLRLGYIRRITMKFCSRTRVTLVLGNLRVSLLI
jgi:hypothetical protein